MAGVSGGGGGSGRGRGGASRSGREDTAKATVAEQIGQAVQSTSNLLHLMQLSSPSHAQLMKLPKNLLSKAPTIKNTAQVLEQLPRVVSSLDAHMESGLESVPHLRTVSQLLVHMETSQLSSLCRAQLYQGVYELSKAPDVPDRLIKTASPSRAQGSSTIEQ